MTHVSRGRRAYHWQMQDNLLTARTQQLTLVLCLWVIIFAILSYWLVVKRVNFLVKGKDVFLILCIVTIYIAWWCLVRVWDWW